MRRLGKRHRCSSAPPRLRFDHNHPPHTTSLGTVRGWICVARGVSSACCARTPRVRRRTSGWHSSRGLPIEMPCAVMYQGKQDFVPNSDVTPHAARISTGQRRRQGNGRWIGNARRDTWCATWRPLKYNKRFCHHHPFSCTHCLHWSLNCLRSLLKPTTVLESPHRGPAP
jgi:hypothetical protein